jgi:IS5 family transposase
MNKQFSLSFLADELAQVQTSKKEFLGLMDIMIPWVEWQQIVQPHYYAGKRGNKPFPLDTMLRIHVVQNLYSLADMATMTEVIDSRAFSAFCGVESSNQVPDGDTIGKFRNLMIQSGLQEKLFAQVLTMLSSRGLLLKRGTIVDSSIFSAPSSTKNKDKQRDPDACQTKKGKNWYFGYKAHIGADRDSGLAHHVKATAANVHDVTVASELLTGEEETVHGDSGYLGVEKREESLTKNQAGKKIRYKINRRPSQSKHASTRAQGQIRRREREKSQVRAKVEHVFGVVKNKFKYRKTRYRGLPKQTATLNMLFALANLYIAATRYETA